ncbi:hypothetical protein [Acidovorax sp. NCPPB 4044]|uniref:hypothetical protein n=1 Tax=Acidovorax sp. NCPPB 4044 TaxID=2940490 RepID=UPI002303EFD1|nr:hypothetical protein [Acidovorax sp. NCPPB 4044]MDA8522708.1 hypothetical protein [Acidovorax sp. NCPPB 4044]
MFSNNGKIGAQRFVPADRPPAQGDARPDTGTPAPRRGGMLQGDARLSGLTVLQQQRAPSAMPGNDTAVHPMPASMRRQPRAPVPAHRHGPASPAPMSRGGESLFVRTPSGPPLHASIEDSFSRFSLHGQRSGQQPVHGDRYGSPPGAHLRPGRGASAEPPYSPSHSTSVHHHGQRPSWSGAPHPPGPFGGHTLAPSASHSEEAGPSQRAPHWTDSLKTQSLDDWFAEKDGVRNQPGMPPFALSTPPRSPHADGAWAPSAPPWSPELQDPGGSYVPEPSEPHWTDGLVQETVEDWLAEKDWGRDLSGTESVADWALEKDWGRDLSGTESVADWAAQKKFGRDLSGTESVEHFAWRQDVGLTYGAPPLGGFPPPHVGPPLDGFPAGGLYASPPHSAHHPWHAPAAYGHSRSTVTQATDEAVRMMEQTMRAQQSFADQARNRWRS